MDYTNYLKELNEEQKQAVEAPRQPILLIAGPGTGKTRTIIARIVHSIEKYQIPPEQILALTFSNKAAEELKTRLLQILNERAEKVFCSTFHSFCLQVLRKNTERIGLHPYFAVCDDQYQESLIIEILRRRRISDPQKKSKGILLAISNHRLKNKELPGFSASVFYEYQKHLDKHNLIDYDQILLLTRDLFEKNQDILQEYRFLFQAILIDEFQDTDPIQYQIVKLLAEKHRNIFVVADDDQSIYAWRGANPENIRRFIKDFRIEKIHFLEKNYRSGASIIEAAQSLLQGTDRIEPQKQLQSASGKNAQLEAVFFDNEAQEIDYIIKKIQFWQNEENVDLNEIAVLYPFNKMGARLSNYLLKERIPFQMAVGKNLTDHPLMKRLLLYLKIIRDPSDNLILEELLRSELGEHLFKKIAQWAAAKGITLRKALNEFASQAVAGNKVRNQLQTFIGNIANLINLKTFFTFERLLQEIINSIQLSENSFLRHNYRAFEYLNIKKEGLPANKKRTIWVFHPDAQLRFIACQMLQLALSDQPVKELNEREPFFVNKHDLVLLLAPSEKQPFSKFDVPLFELRGERRKASLTPLFRWLQVQLQPFDDGLFKDYVVFDLETTGRNPAKAGIVEIAAVKVRNGKVVEKFQTLVNSGIPIEPEAQQVHNISQKDVEKAPRIEEVMPQFLEFIGNDLLIAHNGYAFDFKFIDRYVRELKLEKPRNIRYDSLILARNLYPQQTNSIDALSDRFNLDTGTRHRALDDVLVLNEIFKIMLKHVKQRDVLTSGEEFTEFLALANFLEEQITAAEDRILFQAGLHKLLSPFSAIRKQFCAAFGIDEQTLLQKLRAVAMAQNISMDAYQSEQEFINRLLFMAKEFKDLPIDQAISEFLSYISLMSNQDNLETVNAVSLLTLHAAKGLEFEKVIISGMEDRNIPSGFTYAENDEDDRPLEKKMDEQKRLLYVGMTRGKSEVIFTLVRNRFGRAHKSSPFLEAIKDRIKIKAFTA